MNETYETLRLERDDRGVATITLSRPAVHNCMSDRLIADMRRAIAALSADAACRVVVLTGEGESFCAGADFKWMKGILGASRAERVRDSAELASMLWELNNLSRPVIGRIQGSAYGGGNGLIACCDVVFAANTAKFSLTEVTLGLVPANIAPYVARKMGEANARRTFFTGKVMTAAEAAAMGLVTAAVEPAELDAVVETEIRSVLRCAPGAVAATKKLVDYVLRHDDATNRVYTADRLADAWETDEGKEGIAAFLEKRKPAWRPS
jgi:methylglutaconyl-CoA hydratase